MKHPPHRILALISVAVLPALFLLGAKPFKTQSFTVPRDLVTVSGHRQVPLSHLYMHFLLYQSHLQHTIAASPLDPRPARIADSLRKKIGLSPDQWQAVLASSYRMETAVHATDEQSRALAREDRRAFPKGGVANNDYDPYNPQRKALEAQRQQAVSAEAARLDGELGAQGVTQLRAYLTSVTANNTRVITPDEIEAKRAKAAGGAK